MTIYRVIIIGIGLLWGCQTPKNVLENALQVKEVTVQKWVSGRQESGSGHDVTLELQKALPEGVRLEQVIYKNEIGLVKAVDALHYTATTRAVSEDLLSSESAEVQKQLAEISKPGEIVIAYRYKGVQGRWSYAPVVEKKPLFMP